MNKENLCLNLDQRHAIESIQEKYRRALLTTVIKAIEDNFAEQKAEIDNKLQNLSKFG